jgi:Undecaprenyl-phosphate galactose phosphotransferase WbaP
VFGLYPGIAQNAVREIRQLTLATTMVFILIATLLFLFKEGQTYSRIVFLIGWLLALVLVPVARAQFRSKFAQRSWWGYPIAIFGSSSVARRIVADLRQQPELGLHPVAIFGDVGSSREPVLQVPVLGDFHAAPLYARRMGIAHAIIAMPDIPGPQLVELMETHASMFSHVYVVPGLAGFSSLGIQTRDVSSMLTLEVRRSLLLPGCQFAKRLIDAVLSFSMSIVLVPLMLIIALIIRLESRGGVLYGHRRIGHGGRQFKMWKFRTMYTNGAEILEKYLNEHPEERFEWLENRKLRNDPRVTPVGRILRRASLDELPQLWNILRGEMSMVGPRPIVNDEVTKYGQWFGLYCRVVPGLTGLWQVSGRSDTDYGKRIELDTYYVRNWSPWFDIYLLARTFRTVIKGEGAY